MKKLILLTLLASSSAWAGLPPTTSKVSGDSANVVTFNYQFPNFTGTHTGITLSLGVNSIAGGGTGQSTKAAAFDALSPMSASGDMIYGGASGTGTRLPKGSDGQVLTLASGLPSWAAASAGSAGLVGVLTIHQQSSCAFTIGQAAYTSDFTAVANCGSTPISVTGSVTSPSNTPQVTFTSAVATYEVQAQFLPESASGVNGACRLVDDASTALTGAENHAFRSNGPYTPMTLIGYITYAASASHTIKLQCLTTSGNATVHADTSNYGDITFAVKRLN